MNCAPHIYKSGEINSVRMHACFAFALPAHRFLPFVKLPDFLSIQYIQIAYRGCSRSRSFLMVVMNFVIYVFYPPTDE